MIGYLVVSVLVVAIVHSSDVDWCSPSLMCRDKDQVYQHTMCIYKNQTHTPRCKNITNVQTHPGRFELLRKHNKLRELVATGKVNNWPSATAMRRMRYDDVLENIAFRWATQCQVRHDDCRKTISWPIVGQNIYELQRDSPINYKMWNPASAVDDWFKTIYQATPNLREGADLLGHSFAQMIHDRTEKIGCADIQYEVTEGEETGAPRYRRMIVCNYGPGLEPETQIYEAGPTCSECPSGVRCLCQKAHLRSVRQAKESNSSTENIDPIVTEDALTTANSNTETTQLTSDVTNVSHIWDNPGPGIYFWSGILGKFTTEMHVVDDLTNQPQSIAAFLTSANLLMISCCAIITIK